jgi:hypothetical protein
LGGLSCQSAEARSELFDSIVVRSFGFFGCFFFGIVLLRLGAAVNSEFFNRASPDSSRDVLLFCGN